MQRQPLASLRLLRWSTGATLDLGCLLCGPAERGCRWSTPTGALADLNHEAAARKEMHQSVSQPRKLTQPRRGESYLSKPLSVFRIRTSRMTSFSCTWVGVISFKLACICSAARKDQPTSSSLKSSISSCVHVNGMRSVPASRFSADSLGLLSSTSEPPASLSPPSSLSSSSSS